MPSLFIEAVAEDIITFREFLFLHPQIWDNQEDFTDAEFEVVNAAYEAWLDGKAA